MVNGVKVLVTDRCEMADALAAAGHVVTSGKGVWLSSVEATADADYAPGDYRLNRLLGAARYDLCVLVDLVRNRPGVIDDDGKPVQVVYHRAHVSRWRERRRTVVVFSQTDPFMWAAFASRQVRACAARPNDGAVYVTTHAPTAAAAKLKMRAIHWSGPEALPNVLRAVEHGRKGRTYNPSRDSSLW